LADSIRKAASAASADRVELLRWASTAQTPSYAPTTQVIAAMSRGERARLMRTIRASIPCGPNNSIAYCVRANAIKARVSSDRVDGDHRRC